MANKNKEKKAKLKTGSKKADEARHIPASSSIEVDTETAAVETLNEVKSASDLESGSESEDSGEDDVGEDGLEKVMRLLGEDGLDEEGQMQLEMLNEEDEDGGEDGDDEEDEHSEEDLQSAEDDSEEDSVAEGDEEEGQDKDVGVSKKVEKSNAQKTISEKAKVPAAEETEEEGVALDDLSDANLSLDADAVPQQKITVDNTVALTRVREMVRLDPSWPWTETLVCNYPEKIEVEDVNDDLNRELAFYKQALHSAKLAKELASKSNPPLPFTRPDDYYAEMVKTDAHMARIRQRLLDEQAGIKKGEEKRKEREMKKIGKQVQLEKLKERRERGKEEVEKVKGMKRKRQNIDDPGDSFDIELDDGDDNRVSKRSKSGSGGSKVSRKSRDQKYGFGGKVGRRAKQNTRESTEKFFGDGPGKGKKGRGGGFGGGRKKGKGGGAAKRPGKSRRAAMKGKN